MTDRRGGGRAGRSVTAVADGSASALAEAFRVVSARRTDVELADQALAAVGSGESMAGRFERLRSAHADHGSALGRLESALLAALKAVRAAADADDVERRKCTVMLVGIKAMAAQGLTLDAALSMDEAAIGAVLQAAAAGAGAAAAAAPVHEPVKRREELGQAI